MQRTRDVMVTAIVLATVVLVGARAYAHHGTNINYDRSKQFTGKAVVTEFKYVNPHAQLYADVMDEKGAVVHWNLELLPNPSQLIRNGWTRKKSVAALAPGTKIVVTIAPARAGGTTGLLLKVTDEKGEELLGGGPNAGGPP
ncbi:MAG: DUF6152 family protein [Acidobacteriota bacterium]